MNSNEIVYERKMTGSFMKLRCDEVRPLDEKILLKNNIPGFLPMEKLSLIHISEPTRRS